MEIEQKIIFTVVIILIISILGVILYRRKSVQSSVLVESEEKEKNLECPICFAEVPHEIIWSQIKGINLKALFLCPNCKKKLTLSRIHFISLKIAIILMVALAVSLMFQLIANSEPTASILFYSAIVAFVLMELITLISKKRMRVEKFE